jgi:predicted HD superfamily hydrolase involved in NAD metabolism
LGKNSIEHWNKKLAYSSDSSIIGPLLLIAGVTFSENSNFMRKEVLSWLAGQVPPPRLQHILRVEQMALQLANYHQLDAAKAAQAGLLHDLAKYFKPEKLLAIAQAEGLSLTEVDLAQPHLLHADVSAIVARDQFHIQDPEVLAAIRNHTLGAPGMSLLSCVVFLSDSLEPGRGKTSKLAQLRQACQDNLHHAVAQVCDYTLEHLVKKRQLIHPRMILTRNWALQQTPPRA